MNLGQVNLSQKNIGRDLGVFGEYDFGVFGSG